MPKKLNFNAGVKALHRDAMNRLRKIRQTCGANDTETTGLVNGSGDEFRDMINAYKTNITEVTDLIIKRNALQLKKGNATATDVARDSHDINLSLRDLNDKLQSINQLYENAVRDCARTNKKYANLETLTDDQQHKQKIRTDLQADRLKALNMCRESFEQVTKLNDQRGERKPVQQSGSRAPKNDNIRKFMDRSKKRRTNNDDNNGTGDETRATKLKDNPETAEQMKQLDEQKQMEDAALLRIQHIVSELNENAIQIGQTLDEQNTRLDEIQQKADVAKRDLKHINRGLNKFLKEQKPVNVVVNVICFVLIVAMVGFFLTQFGVV